MLVAHFLRLPASSHSTTHPQLGYRGGGWRLGLRSGHQNQVLLAHLILQLRY